MDSYVIGILSSLTALVISVFVAYIAFVAVYGAKRRKRLQFFGLKPSDHSLAIRISGFAIGTVRSEDSQVHIVEGDGADAMEFRSATRLAAELSNGGALENLSSFFHSVGFRNLPRKLAVDIDVQLDHEVPAATAIVTLGSGIVNRLSDDYLRKAGVVELRIVTDDSGAPRRLANGSRVRDIVITKPVEVVLGNREQYREGAPDFHREFAYIQRYSEPINHEVTRTVVTCSGLGRGGTAASVRWLTEHWDAVADRWSATTSSSKEGETFVIVLGWYTRDAATEPPQSDLAVVWPRDWSASLSATSRRRP